MQVITLINALAHPESHANSLEQAGQTLSKLDAYLAFLTEGSKRTAALAMRAALVAWTSPEQPEAVTEAARAMLVAKDYATFHAELLEFLSRQPGSEKGRCEVAMSGKLRLTFAFDGEDAIDIDLEDYH